MALYMLLFCLFISTPRSFMSFVVTQLFTIAVKQIAFILTIKKRKHLHLHILTRRKLHSASEVISCMVFIHSRTLSCSLHPIKLICILVRHIRMERLRVKCQFIELTFPRVFLVNKVLRFCFLISEVHVPV